MLFSSTRNGTCYSLLINALHQIQSSSKLMKLNYVSTGHRHMQTRLVEPTVESLNSADSFILVTEKFLHVWNGKDSNVMKKSKVIVYLG